MAIGAPSSARRSILHRPWCPRRRIIVRAKAAREAARARPCRPDLSSRRLRGRGTAPPRRRGRRRAGSRSRAGPRSASRRAWRRASLPALGDSAPRPARSGAPSERSTARCQCSTTTRRALRRLGDATQQRRGRPIGRNRFEQHGSAAGQASAIQASRASSPVLARSRSSSGTPSAVRSWTQTVARRRSGLRGSTIGQTAIRFRSAVGPPSQTMTKRGRSRGARWEAAVRQKAGSRKTLSSRQRPRSSFQAP